MQYYDPWVHTARLFINRVVQFTGTTLVVGLGWWWWLMAHYYERDWQAVAHSVLSIVRDADVDKLWRIAFWEAMLIGALATACLFIWLVMRGRLRRGDRHHRGTRVVSSNE